MVPRNEPAPSESFRRGWVEVRQFDHYFESQQALQHPQQAWQSLHVQPFAQQLLSQQWLPQHAEDVQHEAASFVDATGAAETMATEQNNKAIKRIISISKE